MTAKSRRVDRPYHHGDLRRALVQAGTELAREGGPEAIVLREAARRVGVSPNAAYRHFAGLPDLVEAVGVEVRSVMAASMQDETAKRQPIDDAASDALDLLIAMGRGYVHFALREPGLFAIAFPAPKPADHPVPGMQSSQDTHPQGTDPSDLLAQALDGMIGAGILTEPDRQAAAVTAWSAVHGLSLLLLGPLGGLPSTERKHLIDASLNNIARGLTTRR